MAQNNVLPLPQSDWLSRLADSVSSLLCVCIDGQVDFINPAGLELIGVTNRREVLGRVFADFVHHDYRELYTEFCNEVSSGGDDLSLPMKLVSTTGMVVEVEASFRSMADTGSQAMLIEAHDITERKRAADALRRGYEELELRVAERARELSQEISERRRAEADLRLTAQVMERLNEGVVSLDADFRVTWLNPAFSKITGYSAEELISKIPPFMETMNENVEMKSELFQALEDGKGWDGEFWDVAKDGRRYAAHISVSPMTSEDKKQVQQYAAVLSDITKRKQDEERILYQANYDDITGLPNRVLFMDRLDQAIANTIRSSRKLGLMFIDLDGFKLVNDTLGHDVGDEMLRETGTRLEECVRSGDTVARLGGDEFTVIMPNLVDARHITIVAQRVLNALSTPFHLGGQDSFISGSIGVTVFPDDGDNTKTLLKNADSAMYSAKEQGKANYQFYTSALNEEVQERLAIKNGLIKAVDRHEFDVFYQPKLNLQSGKIESVEALMRWNSPDLGQVSPVKFIPVLEESGMVVEVGEWVLRTACRQHLAWRDAGLKPIRVAVNLSARQLREPSFVNIVEDILKRTGVSPSSIEIEITESMLMSDSERAVVALSELHEAGIHISMDDFGTGYSSLSYLKKFPIDTIKIDRSFVSDITTSSDDAEIIRTIISMGKTLNRRIIAEGVETEEQLSMLRQYNCDEIQGFFLSRPLPANELTKFLKLYAEE